MSSDIGSKSAHLHDDLLRHCLVVHVPQVFKPSISTLDESSRGLVLVDRLRGKTKDYVGDCGEGK